MKFSTGAFSLFCLAMTTGECGVMAFSPMSVPTSTSTSSSTSLCSSTTEPASKPAAPSNKMSAKKAERLEFTRNPQYHRRGFKAVRPEVEAEMATTYKSELVESFKTKDANYRVEKQGVRIYLAKDFGFCWGVERSIALAYEAVNHYQEDTSKTLHITNELIHNPEVNDSLTAKNVQLIVKNDHDGTKDFSTIADGDVVILPAFGASYEEMEEFDKKVRFFYFVRSLVFSRVQVLDVRRYSSRIILRRCVAVCMFR